VLRGCGVWLAETTFLSTSQLLILLCITVHWLWGVNSFYCSLETGGRLLLKICWRYFRAITHVIENLVRHFKSCGHFPVAHFPNLHFQRPKRTPKPSILYSVGTQVLNFIFILNKEQNCKNYLSKDILLLLCTVKTHIYIWQRNPGCFHFIAQINRRINAQDYRIISWNYSVHKKTKPTTF